jgi:hypothetical protein
MPCAVAFTLSLGCARDASPPRTPGGAWTSTAAGGPPLAPDEPRVAVVVEPIEPASWGPLGERAPLRLLLDVRALRAAGEGREVARALSRAPKSVSFKAVSGIDPFGDGDWLAAYGTDFVEPDASTLVVRHSRKPDDLAAHSDRATSAREVFVRPRPELAVLVPPDRAKRATADIAAGSEPSFPPGVVARLWMSDAPSRFPLLPREITTVAVEVRTAADGGFDLSGDAKCRTKQMCPRAMDKLRATAKAMAGLFREDLRDAVAPLQSEGMKLEDDHVRASIHLTPAHVRALGETLAGTL